MAYLIVLFCTLLCTTFECNATFEWLFNSPSLPSPLLPSPSWQTMLVMSDVKDSISRSIDVPMTSEFYRLLNQTNLLEEFDSKNESTFFIPTNDAIRYLPDDRRQQLENDTEAILRFHMTQPNLMGYNFYNNELLVSDIGKSVRVNLYSDFPHPVMRFTAQCANIVHQDIETNQGVVHLVDRVLFPSKDSILEVIESLNDYDIFLSLLRASNYTDKLEKESGPFTLLLPDDAAFRKSYTPQEIDCMKNETHRALRMVRRHLIPQFICCSAFNQLPFLLHTNKFRVLDGTTFSALRELNGGIRVGNSEIIKCDQMANNGVVHLIDRVLTTRSKVNLIPANSLLHYLFQINEQFHPLH